MPCTSSGDVSCLTNITFLFFLCHASASDAVNTICPEAPPGLAGRPYSTGVFIFSNSGSTFGCIISSIFLETILFNTSFFVINFCSFI